MSSERLLSDMDWRCLPLAVRRLLGSQCGNDWRCVTVDDDGAYTVWNSAAHAKRVASRSASPEQSPAPPALKEVRPTSSPVSRRERLPEAKVLNELVGSQVAWKPGVTVVPAPSREPEPSPHPWVGDGETFDWSSVELETSVARLRDRLIDGLPERVPFKFHADVLALQGFNLDAVEAAIRAPQRVEIRGRETREKGYPLLAFHRGDVVAILGMRDPTAPMCIAAYVTSKYDPELFHGSVGALNGGGAKRAATGLPTSVRSMLRQLRGSGAHIDDDPHAAAVEVKYKGQTLGKVSTVGASKQQVQTDYQRVVRRMHAIDQRKEKVGAH